jgi:hypothetical protein
MPVEGDACQSVGPSRDDNAYRARGFGLGAESGRSNLCAAIVAGTSRLILHFGIINFVSVRPRFGLARMDRYRLFVYRDDCRPLGASIVIHAADDAVVCAALFPPNC